MKISGLLNILESKKNLVVFSMLKVLVMVIGLITNIIIIRKLSVEGYGVYSVVFMLIGLITTFGFSWSSSSILYYGSKEKIKFGSLNKTFWARSIIIFITLAVITAIFMILREYIDGYINSSLSLLILCWLYVSVIEDYLTTYFLAIDKQVMSSFISVTSKGFFLTLLLFISFDVRTLIKLNILSNSTVIFYSLGIRNTDIGHFEFDKEWFCEILKFSLWQLFGFSGLYLINFGDTVVIKYYMTIEDVGVYNASYKLFNAIASFSFVISNFYASSISRYYESGNYKQIREFFYKERFIIMGGSLLAHVLIVINAKFIINLLYGLRYSNAVQVFIILMFGSVLRYFSVFYILYFNTNGKFRVLQLLNIGQALINLALDVIFIQHFGIIGPAIATTFAITIVTIVSCFYCETRIRETFNDLKVR